MQIIQKHYTTIKKAHMYVLLENCYEWKSHQQEAVIQSPKNCLL